MAKLNLATTTPGEPEIFKSLQGEGASMGKPSTFVRLSNCNLHCHWCDTAYTWNFNGTGFEHRDGRKFDRKENSLILPVEHVARIVRDLACPRIVFTGGEPLLQQPALTSLCDLLGEGFHIEIESNATVPLIPAFAAHVDQLNLSPKLAHSRNGLEERRKLDLLTSFAGDPRAWFKFVVAEPADLEEVEQLVGLAGIDHARVMLMPEGIDSATLRGREKWLADLCVAHGFALTDRLHIHLYGDTRGT